MVFRIWRGTRSSLEHVGAFCWKYNIDATYLGYICIRWLTDASWINFTHWISRVSGVKIKALKWHRSCHSNEMTPLPILPAAVFLGTGNCPSKIVQRDVFHQKPPRCSSSLREICKNVIDIFWGEVFVVRNTVKTGQSRCSAVIWRKWSAFEMKFNLKVVSIFLETCVKDHEDSFSRLLERRIW